MKNHIAALGLALSALPLAASATDAYVTANVNLRSGPDVSYPTVARLRTGTPVSLDGCVDGWAWCDISVGDDRGWVSGTFLQQEYEGERLGIRSYGARIGIPIIGFEFGSYWDDHYRNHPWYGKREHWSRIKPQYRVIEERRGSREHGREDSHNYSHGDTHGNARAGDDAMRYGSHASASSRPETAAGRRPAETPLRPQPAHDDAQAAARSGSASAPLQMRSDEPVRRGRTAGAPIGSPVSVGRNAAEQQVRRDEPARGNAAPVAAAARPAVPVQSATPAQNRIVAPVAAERAVKSREQERDDKDRH